jgi:dihydrofolate reductase
VGKRSGVTIGMIYAVSPEGVIGLAGQIPWKHPGDVRRFQRITRGTVVIMGRATFEETGAAIPDRTNLVVTSRPLVAPDVQTAPSVEAALDRARALTRVDGRPIWFIGGARIFAEGARFADLIDVTYVPDHVTDPRAVHAPAIDETVFEAGPLVQHEDEPGLSRRLYRRRRVTVV